ncbi:hypothetical protein ACNPQM_41360 [Streptomyces sp. NPDC056231]|uniref:hypothetical protein n=1 Tax=Streptomyces sp. NPDC056231 TaxID=3345755 RepID=UPI003AAAF199
MRSPVGAGPVAYSKRTSLPKYTSPLENSAPTKSTVPPENTARRKNTVPPENAALPAAAAMWRGSVGALR